MGILDVANRIDGFWGLRLRGQEVARASGWCSVLVYDAFELLATLDGDSVILKVEGLEPEPGPFSNERVPIADLVAALERLDRSFRRALPEAYLAAIDAWVSQQDEAGSSPLRLSPQERRAMVEARRSPSPTPAGPTIDRADIVAIIEHRFGSRVHVAAEGPDNRVEGVLDGFFKIGVERDSQYGSITAGILLGRWAIVTLFGERLIARHPDEASLRELLDLIDHWVALRLS